MATITMGYHYCKLEGLVKYKSKLELKLICIALHKA